MTWISVKERLPEENVPVLITQHAFRDPSCHRYMIVGCRLAGGDWAEQDGEGGNISTYEPTHWQPLPDPPKEGEDDI